MKKFSKFIIALGSAFLALSVAHATIPNTDEPVTFLGPVFKGGFTNNLTDTTAYSLLGEAGVKNFRIGGTLGWNVIENQYLKLSADYLRQQINYSFFSGDTEQWVQQSSISAGYLFDMTGWRFDPQWGLSGYYSHAPSVSLSTVSGSFVSDGTTQFFSNDRRIAGSDAAGVAPGVSLSPWRGARAGIDINYDHVNYDTLYIPDEDATGLGGTFTFNQSLSEHIDLSLTAAMRQPFNSYQAGVYWSDVPYFGSWTVGVDGIYVVGKNTLPDTYNVTLSAVYALDRHVTHRSKGKRAKSNLLSWTSTPAVYLPQVLAIPDERVLIAPCTDFPLFTGTIPGQVVTGDTIITIDASTFFTSGSPLTYSLGITGSLEAGDTITIDPVTGLITISHFSTSPPAPNPYSVSITVTATNSCGSAVSNLALITFDFG